MLNHEWTKLGKFVDSAEVSYARLRNARQVAEPFKPTIREVATGSSNTARTLYGLPPVADARTKVLILGTFPGSVSLKAGQYYADSRNYFWQLLGRVFEINLPVLSYRERCAKLRERQIGLWDVIETCERKGSLDKAIRHESVRELSALLKIAPNLEFIAFNGNRARRYVSYDFVSNVLPSSSSSNTHGTVETKSNSWSRILNQYR